MKTFFVKIKEWIFGKPIDFRERLEDLVKSMNDSGISKSNPLIQGVKLDCEELIKLYGKIEDDKK